MNAKRSAPHDIDPNTLEHKDQDLTFQKNDQVIESKDDKTQRKVVTIKKDQNNKCNQSQNQEKDKAKPATVFTTGLFQNSTSSNGSGLFFNTSASLFANNSGSSYSKPSGGLFTPSDSNKPKSGVGSSIGSIFNFQNGVPPVKNSSLFGQKNNQQEDSGNSAELQAVQNLQSDPSKSTSNYKYESTCELILKKQVFKFKKVGGDLIENVDLIVFHDKKSKLNYVRIQLPATKTSIYTGLLIAQKSKIKHLNNKKENVQLNAINFVKGKLQQAFLRFQFQKEETGIETLYTIQKLLKEGFTAKQAQENINSDKNQSKQQLPKSPATKQKSNKNGDQK